MRRHVLQIEEVMDLRVKSVVASQANANGWKEITVELTIGVMQPEFFVSYRFYNPLREERRSYSDVTQAVEAYNNIVF